MDDKGRQLIEQMFSGVNPSMTLALLIQGLIFLLSEYLFREEEKGYSITDTAEAVMGALENGVKRVIDESLSPMERVSALAQLSLASHKLEVLLIELTKEHK